MAKKPDYKQEAVRAAKRYRLPPHIFLALVGAESGWDPDVRSPAGARNLTQLMPATAKALGVDINDPIQALDGGARYLRQQLDAFGSMRLALAAYNAGPGAVRQHGNTVPPYTETQRYVKKIMAATPTEYQTVTSKPNKQQPAIQTLTAPPPAADLLGQSSLDTSSREQSAFESLGRIAKGESPTHTLSELVRSVSVPSPVVRQPSTVVQPLPEPPGATRSSPEVPAKQKPLRAGGGWGGSHSIAKAFAEIGFAHGLKAVSEKRSTKNTKTGNVSDHYEGNANAYAYDLSDGDSPTPAMDAAAVAIAARLGVKYDGKGPLVLSVRVNGYRVQVLYRTDVGGNHFNHIHVGAKRLP